MIDSWATRADAAGVTIALVTLAAGMIVFAPDIDHADVLLMMDTSAVFSIT
jgi:hypothetical protein